MLSVKTFNADKSITRRHKTFESVDLRQEQDHGCADTKIEVEILKSDLGIGYEVLILLLCCMAAVMNG